MRKTIAGRCLVATVAALLLLAGGAAPSFAIRYMTADQALKTSFPDADSIVREQKSLSGKALTDISAKLNGRLVAWDAAATDRGAAAPADYTFYFPMKGGKKTAVAVVEQQPGKWGPMEFLVVLSLDGAVKNILVLSHEETKARPICRKSFLMQFFGKTGKDPIELGKDIYAVTGATVSSEAVAFAVKKVVAMYEEFYLNGK